jgi:hypothetical protein
MPQNAFASGLFIVEYDPRSTLKLLLKRVWIHPSDLDRNRLTAIGKAFARIAIDIQS